MPKRFCVNTRDLTKDERKELATNLNDFVQSKKAEFKERRQNSQTEDSDQ